MNRIFIIIICLFLGFFITLNVKFLLKEKKCTYYVNSGYYEEFITIKIKRFENIEIEKKYEFKDEDVMNLELEELESLNYEITIEKNKIFASKNEKNSNYYKNIQKYEELGFSCR